jgi:REP element-mobilizing transposase RayT
MTYNAKSQTMNHFDGGVRPMHGLTIGIAAWCALHNHLHLIWEKNDNH